MNLAANTRIFEICVLTLLECVHNLASMCDLLLNDIRHTRRLLLLLLVLVLVLVQLLLHLLLLHHHVAHAAACCCAQCNCSHNSSDSNDTHSQNADANGMTCVLCCSYAKRQLLLYQTHTMLTGNAAALSNSSCSAVATTNTSMTQA
jgi:hypothetical protein